jgi:hypothetical protein
MSQSSSGAHGAANSGQVGGLSVNGVGGWGVEQRGVRARSSVSEEAKWGGNLKVAQRRVNRQNLKFTHFKSN